MKSKKLLLLLTIVVVMIGVVTVRDDAIKAQDFEGNEEHWTSVCSQYTEDQNTINTCNEYRQYLNKKTQEANTKSQNAQKEIDSMQGDLSKLGNLAYEYEGKVADVKAEIASVNASIVEAEASIKLVEDKMKEQKKVIDARKDKIKERMKDIQVSINTNEYIDFIMGAENLVDFIQRSESIGTITEYDNQQLDILNEEIEKLEKDKKEKERLQATLETQKAALNTKKEELEVKEADSKKVLAALVDKQNELKAQKNSAAASANVYTQLIPPVPSPPTTGGGGGNLNWGRDFYSQYYKSPTNPFSVVGLTGQCTWYCFGRATEVNGLGIRNSIPLGNANSWYSSYGGSKGQTPRANAIVVWSFGAYGHVAFVESYSNGTITISEGNVNAPGGGLGYWTSLETAIKYTQVSTLSYSDLVAFRGRPVGFIYF
ncbi:peptidoglycan hydrolase CwlO-like protein [Breznakia sp. PF5-3]|uniref:coiled-coil domain-containing protein n=1 Tax=unclassified Breznakia TaxID=2623764 RepID=UPI002404DE14|nr:MULTISPECIES: CHAP domain-containing protein [unclassified Breznakia]MDL2276607.1 CHAP domain-containing protein [Breznakia sp. OttesenSCG-928-G09]MDF9824651.1 peptidoglycan hydrolase CwlO-like protein [Breznakia sp. PM6-1]MDF9835636.1 peptidoglycan hydrolase CwlO-like protein [Breznakia sp. PF5-3]MDF9837699.1 peptidoglycan hydrolase CwlO-like protein [Breznakia sp. PFB2-8]MDF9859563.1 peptidoglycan hydrolase CwlO-like protein [Breznakia sp. PH5-24]